MRRVFLASICCCAFLFLLGGWVSGRWSRLLESRTLAGTRIRQLSAVADNLSRILMATETESAMLNRDVHRYDHCCNHSHLQEVAL